MAELVATEEIKFAIRRHDIRRDRDLDNELCFDLQDPPEKTRLEIMDPDAKLEIIPGDIVGTLCQAFKLKSPEQDTYIYSIEGVQVQLRHVQAAFASGQRWHYSSGQSYVPVPASDIESYTSIFKSSTHTPKLLKSFLENAKKASPRQAVALHLNRCRKVPQALELQLTRRKQHLNPFLDIWAQLCLQLSFVGPLHRNGYDDPSAAKQAHAILPVLMHHFGCGIPTWEAIQLISAVAGDRLVLDVGCGNGYWSWILRNAGMRVEANDDGSSRWRINWIDDVVQADAVGYVAKRKTADEVLLLVYPIVGGNKLTQRILEAFKGDTVCYVGTQNDNRYTAFGDKTMETYFAARPGWTMLVNCPLPSFPGKDDALQIFKRSPL